MRLNASTLNKRSLNGGLRLRLEGAGDAASNFDMAMAAIRTVHGAGALMYQVAGDLLASATRYTNGAWVIRIEPEIAQTVARGGAGAAVLGLDTSLYYTRKVQGYGGAKIGLYMAGHVGIVFIDGAAVVLPMQVELEGSKRVMGGGQTTLSLYSDGAPSAIRRFASVAVPVEVTGMAEASHINADGTRYIGFAGSGSLALGAQDGGMLRQSFIGSMDFGFMGAGLGSLSKPTLAGRAISTLAVSGDFRAVRQAQAAAAVDLAADCAGEILVRGEGRAVLGLHGLLTGYKTTFPPLPALLVDVGIAAAGSRVATAGASQVIGLSASGSGSRRKTGSGRAVIQVLGQSDAYLNPYSLDTDEQTFQRPPSLRDFARPAVPHEWRR